MSAPAPAPLAHVDSSSAPDASAACNGSGGRRGVRLYWYRWAVLALFAVYSFSNAYQWIHLNIVSTSVREFYRGASISDSEQAAQLAVDWLSMVYMLAYIPLIWPADWFLDRFGLRAAALVGAALNALGAALKCAAVARGRFAVLMGAQVVCACAQLFILGLPARVAAVWFGEAELATATSIGVFGNQLGVAIGFLIPPQLVPELEEDLKRCSAASNDTSPAPLAVSTAPLSMHRAAVTTPSPGPLALAPNGSSLEPDACRERAFASTAAGLYRMLVSTAVFTALIFLLVIFFFRSKPPTPPNAAQAAAESSLQQERQQRQRREQKAAARAVSRVPDSERVASVENGAALVPPTASASASASTSASVSAAAAVAPTEATFVEVRPEALSSGAREYIASLAALARNVPFLLLTISYGINTGCYYAISTLLSQVVGAFFANSNREAGQMGLSMMIAGIFGSIIAGIWLDRTRTYKWTTFGIYLLSLVGMVAFSGFLFTRLVFCFISISALGFFMTGYLPVGFEFAVELTYPTSEGTSSGIVNASSQLFGIILIHVMSPIIMLESSALSLRTRVTLANLSLCIGLLVGLVMTGFIRSLLLRQHALKKANENAKETAAAKLEPNNSASVISRPPVNDVDRV